MKKKIKGFTLAEVLLTLGIIGVVSALTLPQLKLNVQRQQFEAALPKAINNLVIANTYALQDNRVRTLDQIGDGRYFEDVLKNYIQYTKDTYSSKHYRFDKVTDFGFDELTNTYTTKDGVTYLMDSELLTPGRGAARAGLPSVYSGNTYTVLYVDLNGLEKGPNALGWDLHRIFVDTKGAVIPFGGKEFANYTSGENRPPMWQELCNPDTPPVRDGIACIGYAVDHGYKMTYLK